MSPTFVTRVKALFIDGMFHIVVINKSIIENLALLLDDMLLGALAIAAMFLPHEASHLYVAQKFGTKLGITYLVPN
jgi:hypothetical protein